MRNFNLKLLSSAGYQGTRFSLVFLVVLTSVTTLRSLAHILLPDGGANSIAGLDVSVAGGENLIAMFSQWGFTQLLLSVMMWGVIVATYSSIFICSPILIYLGVRPGDLAEPVVEKTKPGKATA
jgi:hypothetical protein